MFFDWFFNSAPKLREPKPLWRRYGPEIETEKQPPRKISADDDLMTRAENIIWSLGFKGNVAGYEKTVYDALKKYKELDDQNENT